MKRMGNVHKDFQKLVLHYSLINNTKQNVSIVGGEILAVSLKLHSRAKKNPLSFILKEKERSCFSCLYVTLG